jgi:uroporphyrinogen decarboxylase
MNHRDRVLTALDHREPDRVPIDFGSYSGATSINVKAYQSLLDFLGLDREARVENIFMHTAEVDDDILERFHIDTKSVKPSLPKKDFNAPEEFADVWGILWKRSVDFTYAPVKGPFKDLAEPSLDDLNRYRWPRPSEIEDLPAWREKARRIRQETDRALVARLPVGIVSEAQFLRGFEGWAGDLLINRAFSEALHEKLADLWTETSGLLAEALDDNVDILIFGEDLGIQNQLMLSPGLFRDRIKPLMSRMISTLRSRTGAKIAMHTCGSVYSIIDDLIEIGIDVLNPLQSNAKDMEPEKVKAKAGRRLALWGAIDTHQVLPRGTREEIREEVRRKLGELGEGGGYILSADHNLLVDVPPENILALFEAAFEFGDY